MINIVFIQFYYPSGNHGSFLNNILLMDALEPSLSIIQFTDSVLVDYHATKLACYKESLLVVSHRCYIGKLLIGKQRAKKKKKG